MSELLDPPVVLVDMDGVLADFDGRVEEIIRNEFPDLQIQPRENFYIADDYKQHSGLVNGLSLRRGFFLDLALIDGAMEGWARILDAGYTPRICSSPLTKHPDCVGEKKEWLRRHFVPAFGAWVVDTAIIAKNKHSYNGLALIDDRPELEDSALATWQHVIFDKPYNQGLNTQPRLHGWHDPSLEDLLSEMRSTNS